MILSDYPHRCKIIPITTSRGISKTPKETDAIPLDQITETASRMHDLSTDTDIKGQDAREMKARFHFRPDATLNPTNQIQFAAQRYEITGLRRTFDPRGNPDEVVVEARRLQRTQI